jgi:hypothetical protein
MITDRRAGSRPSDSVRACVRAHPRSVEGKYVDIAMRRSGAIEVALIWNREDESLVVFAFDELTSEEVLINVTGDEAAEVYRHPFAYAHRSVDSERASLRP